MENTPIIRMLSEYDDKKKKIEEIRKELAEREKAYVNELVEVLITAASKLK